MLALGLGTQVGSCGMSITLIGESTSIKMELQFLRMDAQSMCPLDLALRQSMRRNRVYVPLLDSG